jgi:hypothetical protein
MKHDGCIGHDVGWFHIIEEPQEIVNPEVAHLIIEKMIQP